MFRQIANKVKGRTKTVEEDIGLRDALDILVKFRNFQGNVRYSSGFTEFSYRKRLLGDIADLVAEKTYRHPIPAEDYYTSVRHYVYSGETGEQHYLDISLGDVEARIGETVIKKPPFQNISVDFLVQKSLVSKM